MHISTLGVKGDAPLAKVVGNLGRAVTIKSVHKSCITSVWRQIAWCVLKASEIHVQSSLQQHSCLHAHGAKIITS